MGTVVAITMVGAVTARMRDAALIIDSELRVHVSPSMQQRLVMHTQL